MNRRQLLHNSALIAAGSLCSKRIRAQGFSPIASTRLGKVRGFTFNGISVFKGIRYGADTASTRFASPVGPQPWTGVCDCTAFGPQGPQPIHAPQGRSSFAPLDEASPVNSEDCLHLNVWTPALDQGRRPVLVYIHGGAYSSSSSNGPVYDGVRLARRGDAVVVTLNHRLNLFGYLYLAELAPPALRDRLCDSGNAGQLDLVLALKWVRDNIASFGGDPSRVLIFGQSGGGAKCATLMSMPAASGLFHRVMTMSGQQLTATTPEHATTTAHAVLKSLELSPAALDTILDPAKISMERLVGAIRAGNYFGPVHDGRTLPHDPFSPEAPSLSANIPMILGNTHDETRLLIGASNPALFSLDWTALPAELEHYRQFLGNLSTKSIIADYRSWYPGYSPADVLFAVTTAFRSWHGMVIESERRARQNGPTWVYNFTWKSPVDGGKWGAPHTLDIPFAFDNLELASSMTGTSPDARQLASIYAETLLHFAATGDPNHSGLPSWPRYDLTKRPTMLWDSPVRVENDPRGQERKLIAQAPYLQPGT